jgi:hypothetical protein
VLSSGFEEYGELHSLSEKKKKNIGLIGSRSAVVSWVGLIVLVGSGASCNCSL